MLAADLLDSAQEGPSTESVIQVCKDVGPDEVCCFFRLQEGLKGESMYATRHRKPFPAQSIKFHESSLQS